MSDSFTVESIGGLVPTQAEGRTAEDRPYYFRARHGRWTLHVGEPDWPLDYAAWPIPAGYDWRDDLPYEVASGDDPTNGYVESDVVLALLRTHLP